MHQEELRVKLKLKANCSNLGFSSQVEFKNMSDALDDEL